MGGNVNIILLCYSALPSILLSELIRELAFRGKEQFVEDASLRSLLASMTLRIESSDYPAPMYRAWVHVFLAGLAAELGYSQGQLQPPELSDVPRLQAASRIGSTDARAPLPILWCIG